MKSIVEPASSPKPAQIPKPAQVPKKAARLGETPIPRKIAHDCEARLKEHIRNVSTMLSTGYISNAVMLVTSESDI